MYVKCGLTQGRKGFVIELHFGRGPLRKCLLKKAEDVEQAAGKGKAILRFAVPVV